MTASSKYGKGMRDCCDSLALAEQMLQELGRIEEMAERAIDTGGREDFDPRGVGFTIREAATLIEAQAARIAELDRQVEWQIGHPKTDGFYECWTAAPPQSHPLQAIRFKDGRWLTSWEVICFRPIVHPSSILATRALDGGE